MSNENVNVEQKDTAEVEKPKRVRRVTPKVEKTVSQIIAELEGLQTAVAELENAIQSIAHDNAAYAIVEKALNDKKAELTAAQNKVYYC
jgi:septal ring factor EnvC (AmiA/AmiB activator)